MKRHIFVLFVLSVFLISGCAQINRDNLRYSAVNRGYEVYRIDGKDSLKAAEENNERALKLYEGYVRAARGSKLDEKFDDIKSRIEKNIEICRQSSDSRCSEYKQRLDEIVKEFENALRTRDDRLIQLSKQKLLYLESDLKIFIDKSEAKVTKQVGSSVPPKFPPSFEFSQAERISDIEVIWPKDFLLKVIENKVENEELIRALSSTASVAQMRDLLTEPSFPPLLPVERTVELGCLPPPDSAVFESTANILATLKGLKIEGAEIEPTVSANLASKVVQLFEETERTLFLQYALFRLCEMSVNSPAEFRNVYPVIIHDIVRRTAEMSQLVNIEKEKTRQEELRLEILKIKAPDSDELYRLCIKTKLGSGISDVEKIMDECKKLKEK
jgi:hypothetical protein